MSIVSRTALAALLVMGSPIMLADGIAAPSPVTGAGVTGTVVRYADMPSANVASRNVDVWLPPGYGKDPDKRYPVLYMHDGQNLFDPATSYGNVDWAVDEVMTDLIEKGAVREAIVVGVWNTPKRRDEYMPQRPVHGKIKFNVPGAEDLDAADIVSDRYLAFLVKELKPFIDAAYRTLPGRADTFVMGSSMGGLISQYAMSQYPDVFGGAGCVSTHWPAGNGIALDDFAAHLPDPATPQVLVRLRHRHARRAVRAVPETGRRDPAQGRLRRRPELDHAKKFEGAEHSEKAWRLRVDQPLVFLLGR